MPIVGLICLVVQQLDWCEIMHHGYTIADSCLQATIGSIDDLLPSEIDDHLTYGVL